MRAGEIAQDGQVSNSEQRTSQKIKATRKNTILYDRHGKSSPWMFIFHLEKTRLCMANMRVEYRVVL